MTTIKVCGVYRYRNMVYRYVAKIHTSISYFWGNKDSLTIISTCLYTSHFDCYYWSSLRIKVNQLKQKYSTQGQISRQRQHSASPYAVYATQPYF